MIDPKRIRAAHLEAIETGLCMALSTENDFSARVSKILGETVTFDEIAQSFDLTAAEIKECQSK